MDRRNLLKRLDTAWEAFKASYAGLSDSLLIEPGVTGAWSVRDILAHVTTREEEALKRTMCQSSAPATSPISWPSAP